MNVETTVINNKTYIEVDQVDIDGVTYVYLVNFLDDNDFLIRKLSVKEGNIYYDGLKDNNEFDKAMMYFAKKHKNILNNEE